MPLRLLLVEDSEDDELLIVRDLKRAGYEPNYERVDSAVGLRAALDRAPWDIVISDYHMPDFTGTEALRLLRERDGETPFIFVSGTIGEDVAVEAMRDGAQDYVIKGNLRRLAPAIERELREAESRRERRRAEESLRLAFLRLEESEERFRTLFDDVPLGLYRSTTEGTLLEANPALIRMLGYPSRDALLAVNTRQMYADPDDRRRYVDLLGRAGTVQLYETRLKRRDGSDFPAELAANAVQGEDGRILRIDGTVLDVTERRQAETALRASEDRLSAILEAALDAIITIDASGVITGWNHTAETMFGWPATEATGRVLAETIVPQQHREAHRRGMARFLATGEGPVLNRRIEITAVRKDGREFPVELAISPVQVGGVWIFSAFVRDITEHKGLQAQLIQAQKMEAVGQLAGGIAHDFNNLLGAITMFGELAARDFPPDDPRLEDLESIQDAVQRATTLTRQLLAFSRRQVLNPVVLDPNAVIKDVLKILHRLIGEDIELKTELDPDAGLVRADAGQLEQVLLNLVVNARDAMPDGGTVVIATRRASLEEAAARERNLERAGDYAVVAVSDSGTGMSPEVRARVFEPFFSTKGAKGTGLGLATAQGIIQQSGGHIGVLSTPGQGTTFTIHLPSVTGMTSEHRVAQAAAAVAPTGGPETILLAEDDPAVRLAASTVLQRLGYTVLVARTAEEALAKAEAFAGRIDLVLSDVVMPRMDGGELIQRLRVVRPEIKALLTSGYVGEPIARRRVLESDIPFLQKPFTSSELAKKLREALKEPRRQMR